jgi:hypothetical protein
MPAIVAKGEPILQRQKYIRFVMRPSEASGQNSTRVVPEGSNAVIFELNPAFTRITSLIFPFDFLSTKTFGINA